MTYLFNSIKEIKQSAELLKDKSTTRRVLYPIAFKNAVCEFISNTKDMTPNKIADNTSISPTAVYAWMDQFKQGLYTLEGAYSVSRKCLSLNEQILTRLSKQKAEIEERIEVIQRCVALGITVNID